MRTFEEFIAPFFDNCSIEAYDLARRAWDEQERRLQYIVSSYEQEFELIEREWGGSPEDTVFLKQSK